MEGTNDQTDLDTSKMDTFKKPKKLPQLSSTLDESLTDSEFEKSVRRSKSIFRKSSKPADDLFSVSFNETNASVTETESLITSTLGGGEELRGLMKKSNPFKKKISRNNVSLEKENSMQVPIIDNMEKSVGNFEKSGRNLTMEKSSDLELTKYVGKTNPFKKKCRSHEEQLMQISALGEEEKYGKSLDDEDLELTNYISKANPFQKKNKSHEHSMQISLLNEESLEKSGRSLHSEDIEPTRYTQKANPFKKSKSHAEFSLQVSIAEGDSTVKNFTIDKSTGEGDINPKNLFKKSNKSKNESFGIDQVEVEDESGDDVDDSYGNDNGFGFDSFNDEDSHYYDNCNEVSVDAQNDEDDEEDKDDEDDEDDKDDEDDGDNDEMEKSIERKSDICRRVEKTEENLPIDKGNLSKESNPSTIVCPLSEINTSIGDIDVNKSSTKQTITVPEIPPLSVINKSLTKEKPQEENITSATNINRTMTWEEKFNEIVSKSKKSTQTLVKKKTEPAKPAKPADNLKEKPLTEVKEYKPMRLKKPASFANKRLYKYLINKLEPKYGIDTLIEAEQIVFTICDTVKKVTRRKTHQKKLIQNLKKELASAGLIETTMDFYEFVIGFLPYPFRVKVVPCLQTRTNTVFPPKDVGNPFDKIL